MLPFWQTHIDPILAALRPKSIVEIGSESGRTTRRLLEFCVENDATLHVIDPAPGYDVVAWRENHGERFVFHRALSLDALPRIDRFDFVLIDGDHNWYTVFHELKLIERLSAERRQRFPLILLHDIDWPYGRRDMYYDPQTIPEEFRHPNAQKGMVPGVSELQETRGLNASLHNAVCEKTPRNGVLTAVEDYLQESKQALKFLPVPGFYGLGILCPLRLKKRNRRLARLIAEWDLAPVVRRYILKLQAGLTHAQLGLAEARKEIQQLRRQLPEAA